MRTCARADEKHEMKQESERNCYVLIVTPSLALLFSLLEGLSVTCSGKKLVGQASAEE